MTRPFALFGALTFLSVISPSRAELVVPDDIVSYLSKEEVTEGGTLSGDDRSVRVFEGFVRTHWSAICDDIRTVCPEKRQQYLLVAAAETLNRAQYVQFLDRMCDLQAAKTLQDDVFEDAVVGITGKKRPFWGKYYKAPDVRALLLRIRRCTRNSDVLLHLKVIEAGWGAHDILPCDAQTLEAMRLEVNKEAVQGTAVGNVDLAVIDQGRVKAAVIKTTEGLASAEKEIVPRKTSRDHALLLLGGAVAGAGLLVLLWYLLKAN